MNVESLLGDFGLAKFVAEYLYRLPLAAPGAAESVKSLGTWESLGEILGAETPEVMLVRDGERLKANRLSDEREARVVSDDGCAIIVRHAERQHPGIGRLAESFEQAFCGPVDVQMFVTPPGRTGFSWHYDAEDVFILQTAGSKDYALRKNTVNPWPLEETLPKDMRYDREIMPLMTVSLEAGDLLYIPCGYWHKADASRSTEAAISLAVGVMSRTAVDVFDRLRRRVIDSMLWRQRLPVVGAASPLTAGELEQEYRELFVQLSEDLGKMLRDERLLRAFLVNGDA
jgi:50S ribosomal protein L16 3-hydroxylase